MPEITTCPNCQRKLQVPAELLGRDVQCPECKTLFVAAGGPATGVQATAPPPPAPSDDPPAAPARPDRFDRPDRPRRRFEDDEDDDGPLDIAGPRYQQPHRGGLILTLGILSLVTLGICGFGIILGPFAWAMGNADLSLMRAGLMDPSGEGLTQAGRVLGIISTLLFVTIVVGYCGFFAFIIATNGRL